MKLWEIFRFEVWYQLRKPSAYLYFGVLLVFSFLIIRIFEQNAGNGEYFLNAPVVMAAITAVTTLCSLLVVAAIASDAATRDASSRLEPLLYTTSLKKSDFLGGRFLGACVACALMLLLALPLAFGITMLLPGVYPQLFGPAQVFAYLAPLLLFALPTTFFATALLYSLAVLTRKAMASYAGGALLFIIAIVSNSVLAKILGKWELAKLLDASGLTVLSAFRMGWPLAKVNTQLIFLQDYLLYNRLAWVAFGLMVLGLMYLAFRFKHSVSSAGRKQKPQAVSFFSLREWSTSIAAPVSFRSFDRSLRLRQLRYLTMLSFKEIVFSKGALLIPAMVGFLFLLGPELLEGQLGVPGLPTTGRLVTVLQYSLFGVMVAALLTVYAGQLVWKERDARLAELTDASPVPDWVLFLGKFLGLCLLLVVLQLVIFLSCLAFQMHLGYYQFEVGLYFSSLFGLQLGEYLLFAALALAGHVLIDQKYVAHMLVFLFYIFMVDGTELGVERHLYIFGAGPAWEYSEMNGYGTSLAPWLWFKLYWAAWAVCLLVVAQLFWARGRETGSAWRLRLAKARTKKPQVALLLAAGLLMLTLGSFIVYNTDVLNQYHTQKERQELHAAYEKKYGQYRNLPQPKLVSTKLWVEIYPAENQLQVTGTYHLVNQSTQPITSLHLFAHPEAESVVVNIPQTAELQLNDHQLGHRIYALAQPLPPGDSMVISFTMQVKPKGFTDEGIQSLVTGNGTRLDHLGGQSGTDGKWLPLIGYQESREIDEPAARKKLGLPPRPAMRSLYDVTARSNPNNRTQIAFEAVVGTPEDQLGVAPGELKKTWKQNGRRFAHYVADAPISNLYGIFSARYVVKEANWKDVKIQVYHHPAHTRNLDRMVKSVQASLAYFSEQFSPYTHRQIKLVQDPGQGTSLRAYPGTITFSEGYAQLAPDEDRRDLDLPFAVMAHEVAHQWWGHQVVPASVEGAPVLTESLAWYSAMNVVEKTYGTEHLERLLQMMRRQYLTPRSASEVPLLRATDHFEVYRIGPFAMFALREYVGVEEVNGALRQLLRKHGSGKPPLPTSLQLYEELVAVTPDSLQYLLSDLFQKTTRWDLRTVSARAAPAKDGTWRVTLKLEAQKLVADSLGTETKAPMQDFIEIGVYAQAEEAPPEKPLYLRQHRIRAGEQTITLRVPRKPALAGIDPRHLLLDPKLDDNFKEVSLTQTTNLFPSGAATGLSRK